MFSTHYLTLEKVKINRKFPLPGPPKTDTLPPPSGRPRPPRSSPFPMAVPWRTLSGMLEYTDRLGTPGTSEAETGSSQRLPEKARSACTRSHAVSVGHVSGRREGARGHVGSRGRPRRVEPRPLTLSSCRPRSGFGANRVHSWASHPGTHSSAPSAGRGHLLVPRSSPRASPAVEDTRTSHLLWPSSQWRQSSRGTYAVWAVCLRWRFVAGTATPGRGAGRDQVCSAVSVGGLFLAQTLENREGSSNMSLDCRTVSRIVDTG